MNKWLILMWTKEWVIKDTAHNYEDARRKAIGLFTANNERRTVYIAHVGAQLELAPVIVHVDADGEVVNTEVF